MGPQRLLGPLSDHQRVPNDHWDSLTTIDGPSKTFGPPEDHCDPLMTTDSPPKTFSPPPKANRRPPKAPGGHPEAPPSPLSRGRQPHEDLAGVGHHLLDEDLLLVALPEGPCGYRGGSAPWGRPRGGQQHPPSPFPLPISVPAAQPAWPSTSSKAKTLKEAKGVEPGWVEIIPRKRVTVQVRTWLLSAHTFWGGQRMGDKVGGQVGGTRVRPVSPPQAPTRDEVLLRQHDLGDGAAVHGEGLEELGARAHRLRVLHDHPHHARAGAVGDLDPVAAVAWEET